MSSDVDGIEPGTTYSTQGRTITEADVVNFAGVSGDFNHLHTDAVAMAETPLGERVVHGTLVFAIATGLLWQSRPPEEREELLAFYGVDKLRFIEPVFIGDTITAHAEILGMEEKEHPIASGIVRQKIEVRNEHDTVVQAAEFLLLVR